MVALMNEGGFDLVTASGDASLRLIAGFEKPNSGKIMIHSAQTENVPPYERNVNTVFQDYALFPHMTILKNVAYGLMVKGANKKIYYQKANEMLDIVLRTFLMAASVTFASALIAFPIAYYMARYASGRVKAVFYLAVMLPLWSSYLVRVYSRINPTSFRRPV